ncbi:hypothetical protein ACHAW6_007811 [Cyclotella cf. meneghiniana]
MLKVHQVYKQYASKRGIKICHYHCDNGCFADNTFRQHAEQQQQTLTFCTCNVNLILNLDTSIVSLQFHCRYNDFFDTVSFKKPGTMMSSN